jgi:hypothetical protein
VIPARVPTREQVREHPCPTCGAGPGEMCVEVPDPLADVVRTGLVHRLNNHAGRVEVCQAWLGRQLELEELA